MMRKSLFGILAAVVAGIGLTGCTMGERKDAEALYAQSQTEIENGNYAVAIEVLDTLNARYPGQVAVRRNALGLKARAMEGLAMDSIGLADAELAAATIAEDSLRALFRHVPAPAPGMEGYWLPTGTSERAMASTGIQARVNDDGYLYMVAALNGRRIGLRAIELKAGSQAVRSGAISAARLVTVGSTETASFNQEEVAEFGPWLAEHPSANKIVFVGTSTTTQATLTPAMRAEIELCHNFAMAVQAKRMANIRREKYERMLRAARDQMANHTQPEQ